MNRILYFDPIGGASGDMILGALLSIGLDLEEVQKALESLPLNHWSITPKTVQRGCFSALHAHVQSDDQAATPPAHGSRKLTDIKTIIDQSSLPDAVKARAKSVFLKLAESEAAVHGLDIDTIHFHEVGATDSIIDIVAVTLGLHLLKIDRIHCAPLVLSQGMAHSAHGPMPLPAPAVLEILSRINAPIAGAIPGPERITPTAAALFAEFVDQFSELPPMNLLKVGVSAGTRVNSNDSAPNVLRCFLGTVNSKQTLNHSNAIRVIQCNLDDQNPEILGALSERCFEEGCLDFFTSPIQMKKNRPGTLVTILIKREDLSHFESILFRETSSFGMRYYDCERSVLERSLSSVETKFGPITMKLGWYRGELVTSSPEFEDCRRAAKAHSAPLKSVYQAARVAWATRDDLQQPQPPTVARD